MSMDGPDALRALSQRRTNQVVFTTMSTIADWSAVSTRPDLDVAVIRPMSKNSSMGLGVALARPDVGVWVLDGDGSLLMNLGSLVTIANLQPKNLTLVVYQNGTYDTTGNQPIPGGGSLDIAAMARACCWPATVSFDNPDTLEAGLDAALAGPHPLLLALKIASAPRRPFPELTLTPEYARRVWRYLDAHPAPSA